MGFPSGSDGKESAWNAENPGLILELGRSPGEGNGYPLQYSCLENPMDRGAWWAAVHGVAKSWTQLSDWHFHFQLSALRICDASTFLGSGNVCYWINNAVWFPEHIHGVPIVWGRYCIRWFGSWLPPGIVRVESRVEWVEGDQRSPGSLGLWASPSSPMSSLGCSCPLSPSDVYCVPTLLLYSQE